MIKTISKPRSIFNTFASPTKTDSVSIVHFRNYDYEELSWDTKIYISWNIENLIIKNMTWCHSFSKKIKSPYGWYFYTDIAALKFPPFGPSELIRSKKKGMNSPTILYCIASFLHCWRVVSQLSLVDQNCTFFCESFWLVSLPRYKKTLF